MAAHACLSRRDQLDRITGSVEQFKLLISQLWRLDPHIQLQALHCGQLQRHEIAERNRRPLRPQKVSAGQAGQLRDGGTALQGELKLKTHAAASPIRGQQLQRPAMEAADGIEAQALSAATERERCRIKAQSGGTRGWGEQGIGPLQHDGELLIGVDPEIGIGKQLRWQLHRELLLLRQPQLHAATTRQWRDRLHPRLHQGGQHLL